jgi:hypothetical protein
MPTWDALDTLALEYAHDSYGLTHTAATARTFLEAAELFVCASRGLAEETGNLSLSIGVPVYTIHTTLADFIVPLRVTVNGTLIERSSLNAVLQTDPNWWDSHLPTAAPDVPFSWFPLGGTLIGFYPTPKTSATAVFTYLQVPPTGQAGGASPLVPDEWHYILPHYASAILFAIEGQMGQATEEVQKFIAAVQGARSPRFMASAQQRSARATDVVVKQSED